MNELSSNEHQRFESEEIVPQFRQALKNILAVLKQTDGEAHHICRMTACCCDKPAYMAARRQLGAVWRELTSRRRRRRRRVGSRKSP